MLWYLGCIGGEPQCDVPSGVPTELEHQLGAVRSCSVACSHWCKETAAVPSRVTVVWGLYAQLSLPTTCICNVYLVERHMSIIQVTWQLSSFNFCVNTLVTKLLLFIVFCSEMAFKQVNTSYWFFISIFVSTRENAELQCDELKGFATDFTQLMVVKNAHSASVICKMKASVSI